MLSTMICNTVLLARKKNYFEENKTLPPHITFKKSKCEKQNFDYFGEKSKSKKEEK